MTPQEQKIIKHLDKCDFREIHKYFIDKNEARKALPKEEKQVRTVSHDIWGWLICLGTSLRCPISCWVLFLVGYVLTWDLFGIILVPSLQSHHTLLH